METNAERLLNDPAFRESMDAMKADLLRELESLALDGSREGEQAAAEIGRKYQTLRRFERSLWGRVENNKLKKPEEHMQARYKAAGIP